MDGFPADKVKQTYFLLALTLVAWLLAYMLRDYISSFLGAVTIYILFRSPLHYLNEKKKWPKVLTVSLLMLLSVVMLGLPLGLVSYMLSSKAEYMVQHYTAFIHIVQQWDHTILHRFGVELLSNGTIAKITDAGTNVIPAILSGTFTSLAQVAVLYLVLYFMMMQGRQLEQWVATNTPFNESNTLRLTQELRMQTMSNALGIPLLIVIEGAIAGLGYWMFGVGEPFFWGVITGFADMIPIIGPALVWIPVSIYVYLSGRHGAGIGLAIYSGLLLVNVEHLFRFTLLKKLGNTHPLVTFFGLVIGISLFGFVGLIFGPLLISYFLILIGIYQREYLPHTVPVEDMEKK